MSQGIHLRKYGVAATIDFELYEIDGVDFRTDWTPAAGDVFMMRDEAAEEQVTNAAGNADLSTLVTDEGRAYSITLALEDMQAARVVVYLVDQATKAFLDKSLVVETYGNASAQHAFDLDTAMASQTVGTCTTNTDMVGTNSAALASVLGAAVGASISADIADLPTVAEFEARTIASADYVVVGDTLARVTLVDTTTTNTDMVGTDSAATEAKQDIIDTNIDQIETAVITNAAGVDIAADIIAVKAETAAIQVETTAIDTLTKAAGDGDLAAILVDTSTTLQAELDAIQAATITNAAGVDIAADIIAVKTETASILTDTAEIGAAGAGLTAINLPNQTMDITGDITGNLSGSVGSLTGHTNQTADHTANVATILTDTGELQTDWTNGGRLDLLLDAVKVVTDNLADSATTIVSGTVSHDNSVATTTNFWSDDITEATADHYNGRIVIFTSGAVQNQATAITDYVLDTGEGKFSVTALTEAPADNVTFVII